MRTGRTDSGASGLTQDDFQPRRPGCRGWHLDADHHQKHTIDVGWQRENDAVSSSRADLTSVTHTAAAHERGRSRFAETRSCGNKRRSCVLIGEEERSR